EKSLANGDDYVSQMDATFQSGMKGLNDRSEQVIDEIKVLADGYKQELDTIKQNNLNEMTDKHNSSMTELEEIKSSITNVTDSLVTKESLPNEIDLAFQNKPYQKYSFTTLEGKRKYIGLLGTQESDHKSVLDLPPGFYEATIPSDAWTVDAPQSMNGSDYIAAIDVYEDNGKRKQIRLVQNQYNYEFLATVHTENADNPNGRFMGWKRVMNAEEFEAKNND